MAKEKFPDHVSFSHIMMKQDKLMSRTEDSKQRLRASEQPPQKAKKYIRKGQYCTIQNVLIKRSRAQEILSSLHILEAIYFVCVYLFVGGYR